MCGCFDNCVGVLVICVLVFTVFCIVCTVFFVSFRLCIFILICFVCTSVRTSVLLTQYCAGGKIETNEMGRACSAYGGG